MSVEIEDQQVEYYRKIVHIADYPIYIYVTGFAAYTYNYKHSEMLMLITYLKLLSIVQSCLGKENRCLHVIHHSSISSSSYRPNIEWM